MPVVPSVLLNHQPWEIIPLEIALEANPGDVSKIGALSVLRKLADHLGLTSLTDHDLRATRNDGESLVVSHSVPGWENRLVGNPRGLNP